MTAQTAAEQVDQENVDQLAIDRHRQQMQTIDTIAETYVDQDVAMDNPERVFALMCQAALRYSELIGTQRVDDLVGPLVENLEVDIVGPGWQDESDTVYDALDVTD